MTNIFIIGGGNQCHYTIDIIEREGKYNIIGIIDSIHPIGSYRFGYEVLGRQTEIQELAEKHRTFGGIIAIGDNWGRSNVYNEIINLMPTFEFYNAIHPSVIIGNNVSIGKGVVAMAGCIFNPKSTIGDFTFFATGAQIEHDCFIDNFASVSAGSVLGGHVKISKYSAVTLGVTVLDRIVIGENSVIGSGSLVLKNIPNDVLAYGNPCEIIRSRNKGEKFLR